MSTSVGGQMLPEYIIMGRLLGNFQCSLLLNQEPVARLVSMASFSEHKLMGSSWEFFKGDLEI